MDLNEIKMLLSKGTGTDLHWFPEDFSMMDLAKTLAAMANVAGGTVLVGISPRSNQVIGVRDSQSVLDRIFQSVLQIEPALVLPLPKLVPSGPSQIVLVRVPPGLPNVYSLEGRYWTRDGSKDIKLSQQALRSLLVSRGVVHFETQVPPGVGLHDLDLDQVCTYLSGLGFPVQPAEADSLVDEERWQRFMLQRGCLKMTEVGLCPTYAALLLFGTNPQQWLPSSFILATRFAGASFSDQFIKQEIRGTLPDQLRQAEEFLRARMDRVVRMVGLSHVESPEYPFEAVREILVNALAHRDYNAQGDMVHIQMFADRLEIHSPGSLPGPVNLENLLHARFARNAVITQVLADMGFVERLGYGLDRVVRAMLSLQLPAPQFAESAGSFKVTLYNDLERSRKQGSIERYTDLKKFNLNPRQEKALAFLVQNQRITNGDYQELCPEVHMETLRRDLADLVVQGALIKIGAKRATYYILKEKAK